MPMSISQRTEVQQMSPAQMHWFYEPDAAVVDAEADPKQ